LSSGRWWWWWWRWREQRGERRHLRGRHPEAEASGPHHRVGTDPTFTNRLLQRRIVERPDAMKRIPENKSVDTGVEVIDKDNVEAFKKKLAELKK
jgi:hypothetical protein